MKKVIIILTVLVISFFCLEIIFRTIIPASIEPFFKLYQYDNFIVGKYSDQNGSSGIKTYGGLAKLKSKWNINNHGWNSDIDYSFEKKDTNKLRIALIGDGYVEALNINTDENFVSLIGNKLKSKVEVYNFGINGSSFTQYLNLSRYIKQWYTPDIVIILVNNIDYYQSYLFYGERSNLSITVQPDHKIIELPPLYKEIKESKLNALLKKSALVRYLYSNIKIQNVLGKAEVNTDFYIDKKENQINLNPAMNSTDLQKNLFSEENIDSLTVYLLSEIKKSMGQKKLIILNAGDIKATLKHVEQDNESKIMNNVLAKVTGNLNIDYIDIKKIFDNNYEEKHVDFNTKNSFYWNEYAHQIVADTLTEFLNNYITLREKDNDIE